MSKINWEYFEAEEGDPPFWMAKIPEVNLSVEVYPGPHTGYRYCLSNGHPRPLLSGFCANETLEDVQKHAVTKAADYLEALSRRLAKKA